MPYTTDIIDFNPKLMSETEISQHNFPPQYLNILANHRQYVPTIASHFPKWANWFIPDKQYLYTKHSYTTKDSHSYNSLILSGSGLSAYKYRNGDTKAFQKEHLDALDNATAYIREFITQGKWILGICFGGQLAVHAAGGTIGRLPENKHGNAVTEAGWLKHHLTKHGQDDEIFFKLPTTFYAPHLHNDFVAQLPPPKTLIKSKSGETEVETEVTQSHILAYRNGYLDRSDNNCLDESDEISGDGPKTVLIQPETQFIHASVIKFSNGARIYQIQPHPEMATPQRANFLVRKNPWISSNEEMGEQYYQKALELPFYIDFGVAKIIRHFLLESCKSESLRLDTEFDKTKAHPSMKGSNLAQYLIE